MVALTDHGISLTAPTVSDRLLLGCPAESHRHRHVTGLHSPCGGTSEESATPWQDAPYW
jgi:hypothetical protein